MSEAELRRVSAFRSSFARRQAARVLPVAGGFAVSDQEFGHSFEHNQLIVDAPVDAATVLREHRGHQQITVYDDGLGQALAQPLAEAGYRHGSELVMSHTGPVPGAGRAAEVDQDDLRDTVMRQLRLWLPEQGAEAVRQLTDRRRARLRGAEQVLFLAARAADGEIAAWCDLYLEPASGIAQIEEVVAATAHTRQGHADAVLAAALHRADAAGCPLRFLIADADDWPRRWYARRGFTVIGRSHTFVRDDG